MPTPSPLLGPPGQEKTENGTYNTGQLTKSQPGKKTKVNVRPWEPNEDAKMLKQLSKQEAPLSSLSFRLSYGLERGSEYKTIMH